MNTKEVLKYLLSVLFTLNKSNVGIFGAISIIGKVKIETISLQYISCNQNPGWINRTLNDLAL